MTINKAALTRNTNRTNERPTATLWINVGYISDVIDENNEPKFVALATGIPLDVMEDLQVKGKNQEWNQFQMARNDLRDQLIDIGNELEPGEARYIGEGSLIIQLRKVEVETQPTSSGLNPFIKKLV